MDVRELKSHLDTRLDRFEEKLEAYMKTTIEQSQKIQYLEGFSKLIITILLAGAGFFAVGYFTFITK